MLLPSAEKPYFAKIRFHKNHARRFYFGCGKLQSAFLCKKNKQNEGIFFTIKKAAGAADYKNQIKLSPPYHTNLPHELRLCDFSVIDNNVLGGHGLVYDSYEISPIGNFLRRSPFRYKRLIHYSLPHNGIGNHTVV